jgi:hypothetical protein
MVDVRDDAEIPYEFWIHLFRLPAGAASMQDDTPHAAQKPCRVNTQCAINPVDAQPRKKVCSRRLTRAISGHTVSATFARFLDDAACRRNCK